MTVRKIRRIYEKILVLLQMMIPVLFAILVGSQYVIVADYPNWPLTTISRLEGAKIESSGEELLVDRQPGRMYYLTFKLPAGEGVERQAVKIFLDHQLIGTLDNQIKTIALDATQELVLDGSQLEGPIEWAIEIGQGAETWRGTFLLPPGGRSVVPWVEIIGLKEDKGINITQ